MIESFEQFVTGKMFDLLSNSDKYMTDYAINNGLAHPKKMDIFLMKPEQRQERNVKRENNYG